MVLFSYSIYRIRLPTKLYLVSFPRRGSQLSTVSILSLHVFCGCRPVGVPSHQKIWRQRANYPYSAVWVKIGSDVLTQNVLVTDGRTDRQKCYSSIALYIYIDVPCTHVFQKNVHLFILRITLPKINRQKTLSNSVRVVCLLWRIAISKVLRSFW